MKTPDETYTVVKSQRGGGKMYHFAQVMSQLLAENEKLKSRLAQTEREREAAVRDAKLGTTCDTCKHVVNPPSTKPCIDCGTRFPFWEWRGVCEENTKGEEK